MGLLVHVLVVVELLDLTVIIVARPDRAGGSLVQASLHLHIKGHIICIGLVLCH